MKKIFLLIVSVILCGSSIFAQQNHWTPGEFNLSANCNMFWSATLNGESLASNDIEVAAFVGEEELPRATSRLEYVDNTVGQMQIPHNESVVVTFKMYDHASQTEYDLCSTTITTDASDEILGLDNGNLVPVVIEFITETIYYDITVSANPTEGGSVTGGGSIAEGNECVLNAQANTGYTFVNWTENGTEVSTDNPYTFTVTGDRTLVANFEEEETPSTPEYPWIPNNNYDGTNMGITAEIQINGVPVTESDRWELGAFCNEEGNGLVCRGDQQGLSQGPFGLICSLTVYGNSGDVLSFSLYDMYNGEEHPGVCSTTVTYVSQGQEGYPWEPLVLNFEYSEYFQLPITGYGEGDNYFYLIATPIGQVAPTNVDQMLSNEYDLFYFDQSSEDGLEWINYKHPEHGGFDLVPGKGYLYANSQNVTLTFTGAPYAAMSEVTLYKDDNAEFAGWNLIGNPFGQTAYIDKAYYKMNDDGSAVVAVDGYSLAPMEGAFVIADEDGETLVFSTEETNNNGGKLVFNLGCNRGVTLDRTIINFENNHTLPKFELNENTTKLYIPQSDDDYAVVAADSEMEELPLNFKAAENGTYTLTMFKNLDMQYLRLVDQKNGTVVDLLANPVYTFDANSTDYANRFMLQFKANSNVNTNETMSPIQYLNNGQLSIIGLEGDSELQVIDMLGRILSSTTFNGDYNQMLTVTPGVYMIRLTNSESTYTQKIVVK